MTCGFAAKGWVVRGVDIASGPRTRLAGDLRDSLRIARCFPEPLETLARHRLHRGVALADVAAAHMLAVSSTVTGTYNVAGPLLFEPGDTAQLCSDAAAVLQRRHPAIAAAFAARRWPLPRHLDRVYDSRAALAVLGYRPQHGVLRLLGLFHGEGPSW
jgi:UDP-glucose 4-epimerase